MWHLVSGSVAGAVRGGFWPPALLFAALAFALAFVPARARLASLLVVVLSAGLISQISLPANWQEGVFIGCWISVIVAALAVHRKDASALLPAVVLAVNTGFWAGAVTAIAGSGRDLLRSLPIVLLAFPAGWLVTHRGALAIKVLASWLIAVAILVAALPTVTTPGYVQDHMA